VKAAIGETAWKKACSNRDDDDGAPLGSVTDHAFAMFTLTNNYFVWLAEAKIRCGKELVCDYDKEKEKEHFGNVRWALFGKFILNPGGTDKTNRVVQCHTKLITEENQDESSSIGEETAEDAAVKKVFQDLSSEMDSGMKQVAKQSKQSNHRYKELKKQVAEARRKVEQTQEGGGLSDGERKEMDRDRKRSARALRPFTGGEGSADGETGRKAMEDLVKVVREREPQEVLFRNAYPGTGRLTGESMATKENVEKSLNHQTWGTNHRFGTLEMCSGYNFNWFFKPYLIIALYITCIRPNNLWFSLSYLLAY
jgi:hypothetical protein